MGDFKSAVGIKIGNGNGMGRGIGSRRYDNCIAGRFSDGMGLGWDRDGMDGWVVICCCVGGETFACKSWDFITRDG